MIICLNSDRVCSLLLYYYQIAAIEPSFIISRIQKAQNLNYQEGVFTLFIQVSAELTILTWAKWSLAIQSVIALLLESWYRISLLTNYKISWIVHSTYVLSLILLFFLVLNSIWTLNNMSEQLYVHSELLGHFHGSSKG